MSALGYLAGACAVLLSVLGAASVGVAGRRMLVPEWTGAMGVLTVALFAEAFLVLDGEVLGTIGLFSRVPLLVTSAVAGGVAALVSRGRGSRTEPAVRRPQVSFVGVAAALCALLVLAQGAVAVYSTIHTGNIFIDALEYHLTIAAQFASTHHTTHIVQLSSDAPVSWYPFNDELLHGIGISLFGRDTLSLFLGVADTGALLLAAWCVGSALGLGPVALCAVCPVVATLGPLESSAMNDWATTWPLIACLAIALRLRNDGKLPSPGGYVVAGAAAGLAVGSKLSSLAPALLVLLVIVIFTPRAQRLRAFFWVAGATIVTGIYWYVRDVVAVGSPLPNEHIPGLPRVPAAVTDKYGYTVAHYLTNWSVIRHYFLPGLHWYFGPLWFVLFAVGAVGVVMLLVRGERVERLLAAVTVVVAVVYLVTPTSALGLRNHPSLFRLNLRYAIPAVVFALLLASISKLGRRWPRTLTAAFVALLIVKLTAEQSWLAPDRYVVAAVIVVCLVLPVVVLAPVRQHLGAIVVVGVVLAFALGYPFNRFFLHHRYAPGGTGQQALFASLQGQQDVKIGVVGLPALYPYLGPTYRNHVSYVGRSLPDHAFVDYATCSSWRSAVVAGHYRFIVAQVSPGDLAPKALRWTETDPAARPLVTNSAGGVFAIGPGFGSAPCTAA